MIWLLKNEYMCFNCITELYKEGLRQKERLRQKQLHEAFYDALGC